MKQGLNFRQMHDGDRKPFEVMTSTLPRGTLYQVHPDRKQLRDINSILSAIF
jgi:hypothetical protein